MNIINLTFNLRFLGIYGFHLNAFLTGGPQLSMWEGHQNMASLSVLLKENNSYEPAYRAGHQTFRVGGNVYMWGGSMNGFPKEHDSQVKTRLLSFVEVFHIESGDWKRQNTNGDPPLGVYGHGSAAVGDTLYFFGGYCNHDSCYHNSIHSLSTSSLHWVELSPNTSEGGAPMRKSRCGTVAFKDGEEDIVYVVAGRGPTPSYSQPGAQYEAVGDRVRCNEQHMFSLSTSE